jgi:hypothetical protein
LPGDGGLPAGAKQIAYLARCSNSLRRLSGAHLTLGCDSPGLAYDSLHAKLYYAGGQLVA